jgi:amino acid transporter
MLEYGGNGEHGTYSVRESRECMHEPWLTSIFQSGGQYHWVSEFAPKRHQRFLSFLTGWLSVLGWQTSLVGTAYTAALAIQGLIALNTVDYAVPGE